MKPFRERNPVPIGVIGLAVLALLVLLAFNANQLPFIGGGPTYHADFADAANLTTASEIRIAGIRVGQVTGIHLAGAKVRIDFQVAPGTQLGPLTDASIQIKTLMGAEYIALTPRGRGQLPAGATIPLSRTTSPFEIYNAFGGLAQRIQAINTGQLAQALNTIAADFQGAPPSVKSALTGLSRLSQTISSRDQAIQQLLRNTATVTGVLAARNQQINTLIRDGDLVLRMVEQRRQVINDLLINTSNLATQLTGLVQDNQAQLAPALANLRNVVAVLQQNNANLTQSVRLLGPFVRDFSNVLGNGRWFDTWVANLVDFFGPAPNGPPAGGLAK